MKCGSCAQAPMPPCPRPAFPLCLLPKGVSVVDEMWFMPVVDEMWFMPPCPHVPAPRVP